MDAYRQLKGANKEIYCNKTGLPIRVMDDCLACPKLDREIVYRQVRCYPFDDLVYQGCNSCTNPSIRNETTQKNLVVAQTLAQILGPETLHDRIKNIEDKEVKMLIAEKDELLKNKEAWIKVESFAKSQAQAENDAMKKEMKAAHDKLAKSEDCLKRQSERFAYSTTSFQSEIDAMKKELKKSAETHFTCKACGYSDNRVIVYCPACGFDNNTLVTKKKIVVGNDIPTVVSLILSITFSIVACILAMVERDVALTITLIVSAVMAFGSFITFFDLAIDKKFIHVEDIIVETPLEIARTTVKRLAGELKDTVKDFDIKQQKYLSEIESFKKRLESQARHNGLFIKALVDDRDTRSAAMVKDIEKLIDEKSKMIDPADLKPFEFDSYEIRTIRNSKNKAESRCILYMKEDGMLNKLVEFPCEADFDPANLVVVKKRKK
jgi:ribosomal protein L37E